MRVIDNHEASGTEGGVRLSEASARDYFELLKPRVMSLVVFTGLAGMVMAPIWGLRPHLGIDVVIPAFLIIVIGGVGSFWGAVIAAILVGLATGITGAYAPAWSMMSMYLLLIAVVVFRARGLLGRRSALEN